MTTEVVKIQINARNRAYNIDSFSSDKVLNAGLSNALDLPYECGSGKNNRVCAHVYSIMLGQIRRQAAHQGESGSFLLPASGFLEQGWVVYGNGRLEDIVRKLLTRSREQ